MIENFTTRFYFNDLAEKWEKIQEIENERLNEILSRFDWSRCNTILDIGCGTGILFSFLEKLKQDGAKIFAMYHAAIAILMMERFPPTQKQIDHGWVQSTFVRELINRRKLFTYKIKSYLNDAQNVRNEADYSNFLISQKSAKRLLSKAKEFIQKIRLEIKENEF